MEKKISNMVRRMAEKQSLQRARLDEQSSKSSSPRAAKAKSKRGPKKKIKDAWLLYILQCGDGSLYTGVTNNLDKRFEAHSRGKGSKYTRSHLPVELVYSETCGTRVDALVREMEVKSYAKGKKQALIETYVIS